MSFAIRKDGKGWRAVNSAEDCGEDEDFSDTQPLAIAPTLAEIKNEVLIRARADRSPVFAALDIMRQDELVIITTSTDQPSIDAAKTNAIAIQTFIQGLRDIPQMNFSAVANEAEMLTSITNAYKALVAAAPAKLKPRFKQALASK